MGCLFRLGLAVACAGAAAPIGLLLLGEAPALAAVPEAPTVAVLLFGALGAAVGWTVGGVVWSVVKWVVLLLALAIALALWSSGALPALTL